MKKFGEEKLVRASFLLSALGLGVMGFTYGIPLLLVVAALWLLGKVYQRLGEYEKGLASFARSHR